MTFSGYAFGLAQRAGLSPEEAARLFVERAHAGVPSAERDATAEEVARWVVRNALALQMIHGQVTVRRDGDVWTMIVNVTDDAPSLEAWGAGLDFWLGWLAEQTRLISAHHGFESSVWREDADVHLRFAPRS
jgi:hypothetical protein